MTSLRLLSVDPSDRGSQRCRLGPGLMSALGLGLGSPVLVSVPGGSCLCTAWPRPDLAEGFLQMDLKCSSAGLISHPPACLTLDPGQLTPVPCPRLKGVKITVVVRSVDFKKHTPPRLVHELVKDMLKGLCVHTEHVINLGDFDTDIKYVVIESTKMESGSAGLITSKTSVEIADIQTVRHYRGQLQGQRTVPLGGLEEVSMLFSLESHCWCSSIVCVLIVGLIQLSFCGKLGERVPERDAAAAPALPKHPELPRPVVSQRGPPHGASGRRQDGAGPQSGG